MDDIGAPHPLTWPTNEGSDLTNVASEERHAGPAQTWSYRIPEPPRIVVPPPTSAGRSQDDLVLIPYTNSDYLNNEFTTLDFLGPLVYSNLFSMSHCQFWTYESRRAPQSVLPFIFLGPGTAAKDLNFLRDAEITMLYAARVKNAAHARILDGSSVAKQMGIKFDFVDVASDQDMVAAFPRAITTISNHLYEMRQRPNPTEADPGSGSLKSPGKVLVYCESGNERSAAVVVVFLMAMYDIDPIRAIQLVQCHRYSANFNDKLKTQFFTYADILTAQRRVPTGSSFTGEGQSTAPRAATLQNKRKLEDMSNMGSDDEMQDAEEHMMEDRPGLREGLAPFMDGLGGEVMGDDQE